MYICLRAGKHGHKFTCFVSSACRLCGALINGYGSARKSKWHAKATKTSKFKINIDDLVISVSDLSPFNPHVWIARNQCNVQSVLDSVTPIGHLDAFLGR